MAVEVHDQPETVDWSAGVCCGRCLTRFTFTGEDLTRWYVGPRNGRVTEEYLYVRCPTCRVEIRIELDHVPVWLWVRLRQESEWAGWD